MLILELQCNVLDEAARIHPDSWWWIKADGCDLVSGISESTNGQWSGDVNTDEDVLKELYEKYQKKLEFVRNIGIEDRSLIDCIDVIKQQVVDDIKFITTSEMII